MNRPGIAFAIALGLGATAPAQAAWWDRIFGAAQNDAPVATRAPVAGDEATGPQLQGDTITRALAQGMDSAISSLGQQDGFWQSAAVRVPIPQSLRGPAALLRQAGMGAAVDTFHRSLNRAAEAAVPAAADIVSTALQDMQLEDVRDILHGGEQAATRHFRTRTESALVAAFRPIVSERIDQAGVGSAYRAMAERAGPYAAALGAPRDLDGYVTSQTLDALFVRIGEEERRIRQSPAARGSALLETVFGRASGVP
ncbi:DUF4197 domain-containing protein [Algiphilus sp.]|uniref:DUF4197 domain-containing protein n=1 Tax=Algiphilus sp. TaxID=1872431 RepID=UPI0032EF46D8